jgi:predicted SAM-dependent methyltransferase
MKIILGAGNTQYEGWTATQADELDIRKGEDWAARYQPGSIDALLAEHVWEHMTLEEGLEAARNCYTYLRPGGYIRCAVPVVNFQNEWYQDMIQIGGPRPCDHPAFTHRIVYDYRTFVSVFEQAGFVVNLLEYCDEDGVFHYTYWNEQDGMIGRSYRFDTRNTGDKLGMVSIIIDAKKPLFINPC